MRKPRAKMLNENLAECCVIFCMFDYEGPGGPKGPKRFFRQRHVWPEPSIGRSLLSAGARADEARPGGDVAPRPKRRTS